MVWKKGQSGNPNGRKQKINASKVREDNYVNSLTGLGVAGIDKRLQTEFICNSVTDIQATDLWRGDDIAARIIETVPNEMLRQGWKLHIADSESGDDAKEIQEAITSRWEELEIVQALWDGLTYERAYGGGPILLGAQDGATDLSQPLNIQRVREFEWLTPLEPRELTPAYYYTDPRAPKFGKVSVWELNTSVSGAPDPRNLPKSSVGSRIHESRLIIFPGIRVTRRNVTPLAGWGDSVLTRVFRVLRDFNSSWDSTGILLGEFSQNIIKIKDFYALMANNNADAIRARMQAVELSKSVLRAVMLDAEEDYQRNQTPVTGLAELLDKFSARLAAAAEMPLTMLMGISPGGLNATGESDMRIFYDRVKSKQTHKLTPALEKITKIIMASLGIAEPENWSIQYNPLQQPTDKEKVETRNIQANADKIYIDSGVLSPEEVAHCRFSGDEYSYETYIDFDARDALEPIASPPAKTEQQLEQEEHEKEKAAAELAQLSGSNPAISTKVKGQPQETEPGY